MTRGRIAYEPWSLFFLTPVRPTIEERKREVSSDTLTSQRCGISDRCSATLKRSRDRSEVGFERYLQLAILGRNLHALGRMLIARENVNAAAGQSRRKAA